MQSPHRHSIDDCLALFRRQRRIGDWMTKPNVRVKQSGMPREDQSFPFVQRMSIEKVLQNLTSFTAKVAHASSTIALLLLSVRPAAVSWFVIPVVINAIKASPFWTRPHVCEEICKRLPTLTHADSASTVIRISGCSWVLASLTHHCPRDVFRSARAASRFNSVRIHTDRSIDCESAVRFHASHSLSEARNDRGFPIGGRPRFGLFGFLAMPKGYRLNGFCQFKIFCQTVRIVY